MAKRSVDESSIISLANAIRTKGGKTNTFSFPFEMRNAIYNLASKSTYKTGTVTIESDGVEYINVPISGITKPQLIHLSRRVDDVHINQITIDTLTIIMSDDGESIKARTVTGTNTMYSGTSLFSNLNYNTGIELGTKTSSNIEIWSNENITGCFHGTYCYDVYGI